MPAVPIFKAPRTTSIRVHAEAGAAAPAAPAPDAAPPAPAAAPKAAAKAAPKEAEVAHWQQALAELGECAHASVLKSLSCNNVR